MMTRIFFLFFFIPSLTFAWIILLPNSGLSFRHSSFSSFSLYSSFQDNNNAMHFTNKQQQQASASSENTNNGKQQQLDKDVMDMLRIIVQAADGRKASEIVALHVTSCTSLCDVMVICSGNSRLQNQAIAKSITTEMLENNLNSSRRLPQEGTANSGWILLDYGNVMVHIMTPKSRLYYNMEGQWVEKGGQYMSLEHWIQQQPTSSNGSTMENLTQTNDPFWS